ncbi:MAG: LysM peptidoglycan-binding domain-containing protein [Anaerolineae bacterium]
MDSVKDEMKDLKRQVQEEAAGVRTHVVEAGDTLSKIAKALLGDADRWPEILEANKDQIDDPNEIKPGQKLKIPS